MELVVTEEIITESIYFIRNQLTENIDPAHLLENHLIGIHFTKEFHERFEDYKDPSIHFTTAYKDFKDLGDHGGLVVTQYHTDAFYIAEVKPGTPIKALNAGQIKGEQDNFIKILKLAKISKKYLYSDYPLLSALRPPFITIRKLNTYAKNLIDHLYYGSELKLIVTNLHPQMLEQMCDEWLRSKFAGADFQIRFELLKTGKTLPIIDIYAETIKGKSLYVQVTHATDKHTIKHKAKLLIDYIAGKDESLAMFISPESTRIWIDTPLNFVSTESIFDTFKSDPDYNRMLHKMIGIAL